MRAAVALVLILWQAGCTLADEASQCPPAKAKKAEETAAAAADWSALYHAYSNYAECDDAAISEAFSDSLCRLLAAGGAGLSELAALVRKDKQFEWFVTKHIDETTPPGQLVEIERSMKYRCPKDAVRECHRVLTAVRTLRQKARH
jgi:hypothetical protein